MKVYKVYKVYREGFLLLTFLLQSGIITMKYCEMGFFCRFLDIFIGIFLFFYIICYKTDF